VQDEYTVTLDGSPHAANGHQPVDEFNQTLFGMGGLTPNLHTVSLANTPSSSGTFYVDLDWAVIEAGDGDATSTNSDFWMDDQHPNITYDSNWGKGDNSVGLLGQYWNHTFSFAARFHSACAAC
jgi:hypothetical protein